VLVSRVTLRARREAVAHVGHPSTGRDAAIVTAG
jgi:hypothetical protein